MDRDASVLVIYRGVRLIDFYPSKRAHLGNLNIALIIKTHSVYQGEILTQYLLKLLKLSNKQLKIGIFEVVREQVSLADRFLISISKTSG